MKKIIFAFLSLFAIVVGTTSQAYANEPSPTHEAVFDVSPTIDVDIAFDVSTIIDVDIAFDVSPTIYTAVTTIDYGFKCEGFHLFYEAISYTFIVDNKTLQSLNPIAPLYYSPNSYTLPKYTGISAQNYYMHH